MKRRAWYPMRSTVGQQIPIMFEAVSIRGPEADKVHFVSNKAFNQIDLPYDRLVPKVVGLVKNTGTTIYPRGAGAASFPRPHDLPFTRAPEDINGHFLTINAFGDAVDNNISKELWFEIEIDIKKSLEIYEQTYGEKYSNLFAGLPTLGGICFGGYPFAPYYVTDQGENSANFGIPREIRIAWHGQEHSDFIDAENALTRQKITTHSATHIYPIGAVKTEKLAIRFSDLPRFFGRVPVDGKLVETWGCCIPYLMLYAYEEKMDYRPKVYSGLLAATHVPSKTVTSYSSALSDMQSPLSKNVNTSICADFLFTTGVPLKYFPLSAASLFSSRRQYPISYNSGAEIFWSQEMLKDDQLNIFVEQSGENNKSLSGVDLNLGKSESSEFAKYSIEIYESERLSGSSPIDLDMSEDEEKYTTLIYRGSATTWQQNLQCAFIRPTAAKYLIFKFTMLDAKGRIVIHKLDLLQSAHVSLIPCKAKTQHIKAINFRLIGRKLASDYAELGNSAFSLVVDHMVANEIRNTIFEAKSLYDLSNKKNVKVFANQRYLETIKDVSYEDSITHPGSFERRRNESKSEGWRRSRTGNNVNWADDQTRRIYAKPSANSFKAEQSTETRTKVDHLGDQDFISSVRDFVVAIGRILSGDSSWGSQSRIRTLLDAYFPIDANIAELKSGWNSLWSCLTNDVDQMLKVDGLHNFSIPPYLFFEEGVENAAELINAIQNLDPSGLSLTDYQELISSFPQFAIQGLSFGANLGGSISGGAAGISKSGSIGFSISTTPQIPSHVRTLTKGTTGNISYQANKTGCSYSQHLSDGYDDSVSFTRYIASKVDGENVAARMLRTTSRELFKPGTERARRAGVNVFWQGEAVDIISASIPLNITLPATADKVYRTSDHALRVRFPSGIKDIEVDVWFDLQEEELRDDY